MLAGEVCQANPFRIFVEYNLENSKLKRRVKYRHHMYLIESGKHKTMNDVKKRILKKCPPFQKKIWRKYLKKFKFRIYFQGHLISDRSPVEILLPMDSISIRVDNTHKYKLNEKNTIFKCSPNRKKEKANNKRLKKEQDDVDTDEESSLTMEADEETEPIVWRSEGRGPANNLKSDEPESSENESESSESSCELQTKSNAVDSKSEESSSSSDSESESESESEASDLAANTSTALTSSNDEENVPPITDYEALPSVTELRVNAQIAYQVWEISAACSPEISEYREAKILSIDSDNVVLELAESTMKMLSRKRQSYLNEDDDNPYKRKHGLAKFIVEDEGQNEQRIITLQTDMLINVKLIQ